MNTSQSVAYPIEPKHIDTRLYFPDRFFFDDAATAASAEVLVKFAQSRGSWVDFTMEDLIAFYGKGFVLNLLLSTRFPDQKPLIIVHDDGTFSFTHEFVATCFLARPTTAFLDPVTAG